MSDVIKCILERTKDPSYSTGAVRDIEFLILRLEKAHYILESLVTVLENLTTEVKAELE